MPPRRVILRTFSIWVVVASLALGACSSDERRDMNYGTDAGVGFVPPDSGPKADLALTRFDATPDATSDVESDATAALDSESDTGNASADSSSADDS